MDIDNTVCTLNTHTHTHTHTHTQLNTILEKDVNPVICNNVDERVGHYVK
jgi:hypothetical protein